MAPNLTVSILERTQVSPPADTIPQLSLPLTFFDIPVLDIHRVQCIFFYELPQSKTNVVDNIVPNLKASLSLALKHFLPFAGNLIIPTSSGYPELLYMEGDSIPLILAECEYDFNFLKGNHPQKADDFYPLVPELPRVNATAESHCKKIPLLAMQITLFPNAGMTIGVRFHHVLGDAKSIAGLFKAWTSISKLGGDSHLLDIGCLPCFDRSLIKDPYGLAEMFWSSMKDRILSFSQPEAENGDDCSDSDQLQATYVFTPADIQKLKSFIHEKIPELVHVSSFVVTCAYVWTCLMNSGAAVAKKLDENEIQCFAFPVDCRARLKPPLPESYFGNCLIAGIAKVVQAQLIGNEGFVIAAAAIGEAIQKIVCNEDSSSSALVKSCISQFEGVNFLNLFAVSGSPKFDVYEADFGWGKPQKFDIVFMDYGQQGAMSLHKSRKFEGGLEVGLSLSKIRMEAFQSFFTQGLKNQDHVKIPSCMPSIGGF